MDREPFFSQVQLPNTPKLINREGEELYAASIMTQMGFGRNMARDRID